MTISDATSGATIYYTTNGTTPTTSSTLYTGPITVSSTETLEAIAAATGDTNSAVASATYTITPDGLNADLLTRRRDLYLRAVGDHLRCHLGRNHLLHDQRNDADHVLDPVHRPDYGQLDGDAGGDRGSHRRHQQRGRVRCLHHHAATVSTPTFSPAAGTYTSAQSVSISDATSGATIYYTTNGTTPTTSSTQYTGPITVSSTETLEAIAVATGRHQQRGRVGCLHHTPPTVSTPTFSPAAGTYTSAQSVSISDATSGATIYYTTNGTTPTTSSTQYTGPITVSATETLEAIAVATGDTNSAVASATYTITPHGLNADLLTRRRDLYLRAVGDHLRCHLRRNHLLHHQRNYADHVLDPVHRPDYGQRDGDAGGDRGSHGRHQQRGRVGHLHHHAYGLNADLLTRRRDYTSAQSVTISDATSGATIYYTTNGTTPTTSSTQYTGPITVSTTETLEAIAVATGDTNSAVASAAYTITPTVGLNADLLPRRRDLYLRAVGDHLRCHLRRNHLLHDQRNYADNFLDPVYRADYGEFDGDAGGDRGSHGRHQQRGRVRRLHHTRADGLNADLLTCRRDLYLRAVGDHLRCHLRRNHLLHDQRNDADHVLDPVHRPDYGQLDGDAGGDRGSHGRHQQRGRSPPTPSRRTVSTPTFSPPAGTYTSAQTVTISDATSGATIYYTTNGTTPTTSSAQYTGPDYG